MKENKYRHNASKPKGIIRGIRVDVKGDDVTGALRVLKKRVAKGGVLQEIRDKSFFESKGTKRRKMEAAGTRRFKRKMEKLKSLGYGR